MGIEQVLSSSGKRGADLRRRINVRTPSKRPVSSYARGETISKRISKTGGGGGFNWNPTGRTLPTTPEEVVQANINASAIGGAGSVISVPSRFVAPIVGSGLGLLAGLLLFGGKGQEQDVTVTPTVTPTQTVDFTPIQELLNKILTNQSNQTDTEIDLGGDSAYTNVSGYIGSPITQTDTYSEVNNIVNEIQYAISNANQTTTTTTTTSQIQEQGLDLITLALIGVGGFIAVEVLK